MRTPILIVAAVAALLLPTLASAQDDVRPLDRIYGPRKPGEARPPGPITRSPAMQSPARNRPAAQSTAPGTRPLDRMYGPPAGGSGRSAGVGGGTTAGRPKGGTGLGAGNTRAGIGATRKPAGPTYRGGSVGTRPRFSNSPSLSRPRR